MTEHLLQMEHGAAAPEVVHGERGHDSTRLFELSDARMSAARTAFALGATISMQIRIDATGFYPRCPHPDVLCVCGLARLLNSRRFSNVPPLGGASGPFVI